MNNTNQSTDLAFERAFQDAIISWLPKEWRNPAQRYVKHQRDLEKSQQISQYQQELNEANRRIEQIVISANAKINELAKAKKREELWKWIGIIASIVGILIGIIGFLI